MESEPEKYVPPHLRSIAQSTQTQAPTQMRTLEEGKIKVKTNSPYEPLKDLSSLMSAKALKFSAPTCIQKHAIPVILKGHHFLCRAPTGMGKTLTFLLPLVENIKYKTGTQVLIIAPTRELVEQIKDEAEVIIKSKGLRVVSVYGKKANLSAYSNIDIIVATPGRMLDILQNGILTLRNLKTFVLDEADKLLDMGFERDLKAIKEFVNKDAQVCLFSATYEKNLENVINYFLPANKYVVEIENETISTIKQEILQVKSETEKQAKLKEVLQSLNLSVSWSRGAKEADKVLIFVEKKRTADEIDSFLRQAGYSSMSIHGDKEQSERNIVMDRFKKGSAPILVATSVAARGIDVKDIKVVVNYDFPRDIKEYIHRIGRTGREGKFGEAVAFFDMRDVPREVRIALISVLQESGNVVPDFLNHEVKHQESKHGHFRSAPYVPVVIKDNPNVFKPKKDESKAVIKQLQNLEIKKQVNEEKEDSDDDVPGNW